jgi:hypothetical protein
MRRKVFTVCISFYEYRKAVTLGRLSVSHFAARGGSRIIKCYRSIVLSGYGVVVAKHCSTVEET